jgi:hypothetical protein
MPKCVLQYKYEKIYGEEKAMKKTAKKAVEKTQNFRVKMELTDTPLWRRVDIPQGSGFDDLHIIIQEVFGWDDSHLHEFNVMGKTIVPDESLEEALDYPEGTWRSEDEVNLDMILRNRKSFLYLYDFGDSWEVKITPEEEVTGGKYPALVEFGGCMAQDDCGGADALVELINDGEVDEVDKDDVNLILQEIFSN